MAEESLLATQKEVNKLRYKEQYEKQVETLKEIGFIYELPESKKLGFVDIEGKERPVPSFEALQAVFEANKELIEKKEGQGFKVLQITPFGAPLKHLRDKVSALILTKHKEGNLKATNGDTLELNKSTPLWVWDGYTDADINGKLVYYPQSYDETAHGGKTKAEHLNEQEAKNPELAGWTLLLHEGIKDLPAEGEGEEVGGRQQPEANQTPEAYLETLQTDPQYAGETGYTPEDWLTTFAQTLQQDNQVIDDWQGQGKLNWNLAGYFPGSRLVSIGRWGRSTQRAGLGRDVRTGQGADDGVRPAVRIF